MLSEKSVLILFVCELMCIGFPSEQADHAVPRPVQTIRNEVTGASAGMCHSLFVTAGGVVFTCGDGHDGRLGHGDDSIRLKPIPVAALVQNMVHAVAVQAGGAHTLVLSNAGEVSTYVVMLERTDMSGKVGTKSKAYVHVARLMSIFGCVLVSMFKCKPVHYHSGEFFRTHDSWTCLHSAYIAPAYVCVLACCMRGGGGGGV